VVNLLRAHLRRGNTPGVFIDADQITALETTDAIAQGKRLGSIFSDSEPEISAAGVVIDDRFLAFGSASKIAKRLEWSRRP
jgi:hypothetical protein